MSAPNDMRVQFDHDGVTWTISRPVPRWAFLVLASAPTAVGLAVSTIHWGGLVATAVVVAVGAAVGRRVTRPHVLRLSARDLSDGETTVRLDDLTSAAVSEDPTTERCALVLDTVRGDRHVVGLGAPREHLAAFAGWLAEARERIAERERSEGREWSFLRRPPEAITRLRD